MTRRFACILALVATSALAQDATPTAPAGRRAGPATSSTMGLMRCGTGLICEANGTVSLALPTTPGPIGPAGDPGPGGPPGPPGPPGPTGQQGPIGKPGIDGQNGAAGAQGSAGVAGQPGIMGPAGPAGQPGQPGQPGPQGAVGATGASGLAGSTGATGLAGPAAIRCARRIQTAVDGTFTTSLAGCGLAAPVVTALVEAPAPRDFIVMLGASSATSVSGRVRRSRPLPSVIVNLVLLQGYDPFEAPGSAVTVHLTAQDATTP